MKAVVLNPDAMERHARRWHARHCDCGGVLEDCSLYAAVKGLVAK